MARVTRVTLLVNGLGPVDENLFVRRLIVRDRLEGDVRDDAAHLFALLVLLALVYETTVDGPRAAFVSLSW